MKNKISEDRFEEIVREAYNSLPPFFLSKIDNVEIVIEDYSEKHRLNNYTDSLLLGLYSGIPLNKRGHYYGSYPTMPDKITIFKNNILHVTNDEADLKERVYEVLFHEIGHYFGMNEEEIRNAMKNFKIHDFDNS
jgi:predicted Zn-dependent protease with MMP-like domain